MMAGRLRHKVTIERLVAGSPQQFGTGEPDDAWTAYLSDIWATVEPLSGRELFAAQEHLAEVSTRVRLRYRDGITAQMRVVFEGRYYNVGAVIDRELRHRELELLCTEGANEG